MRLRLNEYTLHRLSHTHAYGWNARHLNFGIFGICRWNIMVRSQFSSYWNIFHFVYSFASRNKTMTDNPSNGLLLCAVRPHTCVRLCLYYTIDNAQNYSIGKWIKHTQYMCPVYPTHTNTSLALPLWMAGRHVIFPIWPRLKCRFAKLFNLLRNVDPLYFLCTQHRMCTHNV